jgi:hypothetical protein
VVPNALCLCACIVAPHEASPGRISPWIRKSSRRLLFSQHPVALCLLGPVGQLANVVHLLAAAADGGGAWDTRRREGRRQRGECRGRRSTRKQLREDVSRLERQRCTLGAARDEISAIVCIEANVTPGGGPYLQVR